MNSCCSSVATDSRSAKLARMMADRTPVPSSCARHGLVFTRWSLPALILVLLPKCPACLAAYIALGTGVSLSVATSSYLRMLLIVVCGATLIFNVGWLMKKFRTARSMSAKL